MKLSEITEQLYFALTPNEKWELVCSGSEDAGDSAEFALLLGNKPSIAKERAEAAARLYAEGRVKTIIPSGGVLWDIDGEKLSEAQYMARVLSENGVPENAILIENEATTTKENMIFGALQILRRSKFYSDKRVIIVTSEWHMKRSLELARAFMPRFVKLSPYPAKIKESLDTWLSDKDRLFLLDTEIYLLLSLYRHGLIEDREI